MPALTVVRGNPQARRRADVEITIPVHRADERPIEREALPPADEQRHLESIVKCGIDLARLIAAGMESPKHWR